MANRDDSLKKKIRKAGKRTSNARRSSSGGGAAARRRARRVRPTARAKARKAKISKSPMPKPPARRTVKRPSRSPKAAEADPELAAKVTRIQDKFERLEGQAQLSGVYSSIGNIDAKLTDLPFQLEALRDRGYVHSGQLEDKLEALDDKWDEVRPRVETALKEQVERLDRELEQTERRVDRLRPTSESTVEAADSAVESLENRITAARRAVEGLYDGMETDLHQIEYQLDRVRQMFDLLDGAPEIALREAEGPLLAVESEWHQDGEEGPKGYLFLTDQRLLFEQREEVVTKKRFGIFKADSEMVQKLLLETEVHAIDSIEHKEEGGFLGMGKDDIIELVFAASAPVSRARFHLKGQDSADWAAMIKRIQTGDIDEDRSEEYVEELETAGIVSASFPAQCPNCFAAVPEQPRGVTSYTCEFCGAVITPEEKGGAEDS